MTAAAIPPGKCVSCASPTGTCTRAEGDPDWLVSFLVFLGVARDQAEAAVPAGANERSTLLVPICGQCAIPAGVLTALCLPGWDVPVTRQPEGGQP